VIGKNIFSLLTGCTNAENCLASGRSNRYHAEQNFQADCSARMLNLILSTIVFFVAAWFANRYLDEQGIPKGMTRGVLVFVLASLVSWGAGEMVDWAQVKIEGPQAAAQSSGDLSLLLKAVGQQQP
jgi:hypothetical protein